MNREKIRRYIRYAIYFIGAFATVNAVVATFVSNMNLGTILAYTVGLSLLACAVFFDFVCRKIPRFVRYLAVFLFVVETVFVSCLFLCGDSDNADYGEDAVIVLGAGIHGEKVGVGLQGRLDRAVEYHLKNPNALIIVSGGQGPGEDITEALAMERYLIARGVSADKIIKEEKSTSTNENFRFSKTILDERFGDGYKVAFITTDYHIYRAENIAEKEGISNITHLHSDSGWYTVFPNGLRESFAVMKMWFFD